jgi:hypothetical protein
VIVELIVMVRDVAAELSKVAVGMEPAVVTV